PQSGLVPGRKVSGLFRCGCRHEIPVASLGPGRQTVRHGQFDSDARRVAFAPNSGSLVILRGEIAHKNFWLLNPQTGTERQLTDLPSSFVIGDFDVSPDGTEIIFDRVQDSSSIALIERAR
ncbi:MAG TPA: hypothetical protein VK743_20235, partial [Steroidobacteraceae bacterium]|nr:hypothetical protein [Steroidobacteraceae bacterium]